MHSPFDQPGGIPPDTLSHNTGLCLYSVVRAQLGATYSVQDRAITDPSTPVLVQETEDWGWRKLTVECERSFLSLHHHRHHHHHYEVIQFQSRSRLDQEITVTPIVTTAAFLLSLAFFPATHCYFY